MLYASTDVRSMRNNLSLRPKYNFFELNFARRSIFSWHDNCRLLEALVSVGTLSFSQSRSNFVTTLTHA